MNRTRAKRAGAAVAIATAVLAGCGQQNGMGGQEGEVPPAPPAPNGQPPEGQPPGGPPPEGQPPGQPPGSQPPGGQQQGQDPVAQKQALQGKIDQLLEQQPITFEPDTADITQQGEESVTKASELIKQAPPEMRFQIVGHVARTGDPGNAMELSKERAQAVSDKLVESGVAADRMDVIGKGDTAPLEDFESSRRVEIKVL